MQKRRPTAPPASAEFSIELTTQELLQPAPSSDTEDDSDTLEVSDISEIDPLLRTDSFEATFDASAVSEDSVEIELTAEQMEAMHDGSERGSDEHR